MAANKREASPEVVDLLSDEEEQRPDHGYRQDAASLERANESPCVKKKMRLATPATKTRTTGKEDDSTAVRRATTPMPAPLARLREFYLYDETTATPGTAAALATDTAADGTTVGGATINGVGTPLLETPTNPSDPTKELYKTPELADHLVPKYSTLEQVEYSNPRKFCISPGYWQKWSAPDYKNFIEHLRLQFDPMPFARATGKPVEEVTHMFTHLVAAPLYNASEAKKRGEEGMAELFDLYRRKGQPYRPWCDGKGIAKLYKVAPGRVLLITKTGNKIEKRLDDLGRADIKYLEDTLMQEDKKLVLDGEVGSRDERGEDGSSLKP